MSRLEGLDDDHSSAAAGARLGEGLHLVVIVIGARFILGRRHLEQVPGAGEVLGAPAIGEQAVVADAVEAVGEHVDEEAADELVRCERL